MQYHSEFNHHRSPSIDRTPWNIAERTGDARALEVYRFYAKLRMQLVPYLAEQARRSVESGRPLMRALFFDHPGDGAIWEHPYEYLLGDDLLVAPVVTEGATARDVYLPQGRWVDLWTGDETDGAQLVTRDAPLEVVPVYVTADRAAQHRATLLGG
jgi:alpha-glucosidase (family GH31 glycosyl hydrolase)